MITILLLFFVQIFSAIASDSSINLSTVPGQSLVFQNSGIHLKFTGNMFMTVSYNKNGKLLSLNNNKKTKTGLIPPFYVVVNNQVIDRFILDFENTKSEIITTNIGVGERLTLRGIAQTSSGISIEQVLTIELYQDFPNTAIVYAEFKNISSAQTVNLDTVYVSCHQLDASHVDSTLSPHSFYTFYGTAGRPFRQIDTLLPEGFSIDSYSGRPNHLEGIKKGNGGIPIIDVWCKDMGFAIGHVEPKWQNLYFPIKVQKNGKVLIAIKEIPELKIGRPYIMKPGEIYQTVKSFVNVHSLDFYNTVEAYSEILKREGIDMHTESTENDYLSAWCSWNDYSTHAMASKNDIMLIGPILDRLNELKSLKIGEIIFDAGWFDNQGDWRPNTDSLSFPGGDPDLISAIKTIHEEGFRVKLWISYLTADPWSEVAKLHPEWMIKKADGSYHLDRWNGYTMCPTLAEVQEYYKDLAERFVGLYGADGFKVDGMYVCPPCNNQEHHHKNPIESSQDYHKVFQAFYRQAKSINTQTTIMSCPCGTVCDYTSLPYITETIAADPESYRDVRRKSKLYRALKGNQTPYSSDYIDIVEGNLQFPVTLPNAIGVGAIPQTFYGESPAAYTLEIIRKWFTVYSDEMISQAEFLNLYDMYFDKPETYVFKKIENNKDVFYFSFYADESEWNDTVEFRGLDRLKDYLVYDYVNKKEMGILSGYDSKMDLSFKDYLLLKCIER